MLRLPNQVNKGLLTPEAILHSSSGSNSLLLKQASPQNTYPLLKDSWEVFYCLCHAYGSFVR